MTEQAMEGTQQIRWGFALAELSMVLAAWVSGEGDLLGLLAAWWEVVSGQVAIGV